MDETPSYYAKRAAEYDQVYEKPDRQENLAQLRKLLRCDVSGTDLIEVACGTGYWTHHMAAVATSITGVDINEEVLRIAKARQWPRQNVSFQIADAYELPKFPVEYEAGAALFWWSHVPKSRLAGFLSGFHKCLGKGARVIFMDNNYVEGSSTAISRKDQEGNTYQRRILNDGSEFEVVKNFPSREEIRSALAPYAEEMVITRLKYYWYVAYTLDPQLGKD